MTARHPNPKPRDEYTAQQAIDLAVADHFAFAKSLADLAFVDALRKAGAQCQLFPDLAAAPGNLRRYAGDNQWREEQERSAAEATAGNVSYIEALHQRVDDLLRQIREAA